VDDVRTQALPADDVDARPLLPASTVVKVNPRAAAYMLRESHGGLMDETGLHGSLGTGIRAPDGFNLAFTNNPHLRPETSISFDTGIKQRFFQGKAVLDLTYFNNHFNDQIVTLGGSLTNLSTFSSDNLGNSRAQGGEVSFQVQPLRSLQMSVEYTRDDTAVLSLNGSSLALAPLQVGQQLIGQPRNSGAYNLTWRHGNRRGEKSALGAREPFAHFHVRQRPLRFTRRRWRGRLKRLRRLESSMLRSRPV
jgi:outer membrane receptor protein involved in Fe transport